MFVEDDGLVLKTGNRQWLLTIVNNYAQYDFGGLFRLVLDRVQTKQLESLEHPNHVNRPTLLCITFITAVHAGI